jgi:hypothetical protein
MPAYESPTTARRHRRLAQIGWHLLQPPSEHTHRLDGAHLVSSFVRTICQADACRGAWQSHYRAMPCKICALPASGLAPIAKLSLPEQGVYGRVRSFP